MLQDFYSLPNPYPNPNPDPNPNPNPDPNPDPNPNPSQDFYSLRLALYNKRKLHLSEMLTQDWSKLDNKLRFVLAVVAGQLKIGGRKKAELVQQLQKDGYARVRVRQG